MPDVALMQKLVALKQVLDSNDERWEREMVALQRNALQVLFSRTERLRRTMSAVRREAATIVVVATADIESRLDAAIGAPSGLAPD